MPGTIHVTVLEAVDLPAELKESPELVAVTVALGSQEFTTGYRRFETKSTGSWDSDFAFPVLNLKDKLGVALCDPEGKTLTKCEIEVPSILQQGYREEYVGLSAGGRLHLKLSFVLTDEERKKVNEMRKAAQRKKEKEQKDDMMVRRSNKLTKSIERAYDLKRKEDYCTDNGLRTIAENKEEHAGKHLDNWEVFSREKDKEVSPASLFALPQPPQSPALKPSSPVETGKPVEISADRERCSKNKYISPCSLVEGVLCHSSLNQDNIMEGTGRTSSPEPTVPACSPSYSVQTPPDSESEVGAGSTTAPAADNAKAAPFALPATDEQKENRPTSLTSVDSICNVESQDDHVSCHAPEVEECMEIRLLETRQEVKKVSSTQGFPKPREENPLRNPKGRPVNNPVEPDSETDVTQMQSVLKETKVTTLQVLAPKEEVTSCQESSNVVQGVVAAVTMSTLNEWEPIKKLPKVKEVDRISTKLSRRPNVVKETPSEGRTRSGVKLKTVCGTPETGTPKLEACDYGERLGTLPAGAGSPRLGVKVTGVFSTSNVASPKLGVEQSGEPRYLSMNMDNVEDGARGIEEKIKLQTSAPKVDCPKVGPHQVEPRQKGSPKLLKTAFNSYEASSTTTPKAALSAYETGSPRPSPTFAKVEKNSRLLSRLLSDDCFATEEESRLFMSRTSVPTDGWVCVERPPMTWEDALKVAQTAREAALATKQQSVAPFPLSSPVKLPTYNVAGPPSPVAPVGVAKGPTLYSLPPTQDVVFAPLLASPKLSTIKARITPECAKAHIETYESGFHQTMDQSSGKVGYMMMPVETSSTTGVQMVPKGRRTAEEELIKWEERLRNWGQDGELKVIQEESRHGNHDRERQLSWDMDDFEDSIRKDDFEDSIRKDFEVRLQSPSSDSESISSRLSVPAAEKGWEVEDATRSEWLREDKEAPTTNEDCLYMFEDLKVEDMEESLMEVSKHEKSVDTLMNGIILREEERAFEDSGTVSRDEEKTIEEHKLNMCMEKVMEVVALHFVAEKAHDFKYGDEVSNLLSGTVAIKSGNRARELAKTKNLSKPGSLSELMPPDVPLNQTPFAGDSLWAPGGRKEPKVETIEYSLIPRFIHTDNLPHLSAPETWLGKAIIDECSGAKADLIIENLCKSLEPASDFLFPGEQTPESSICGEDCESSTYEEKHKTSLIGCTLKQVLGGAVLAAGVFVLWPKNAGNSERYHIVKNGETLSNILPEHAIAPASKFCKLNPQVCERKTVYPGQRLRLA